MGGSGRTFTITANADDIGGGEFKMNTGDAIVTKGANIKISGNDVTVGRLTTEGGTSTSGNITLIATSGDVKTGKLIAGDKLTVKAGNNITATGLVESGEDMLLRVDTNNNGTGVIRVARDVKTKQGDLTFDGDVIANRNGDQLFNANAIDKQLIVKGTITKNTNGDLTLQGGRDGQGPDTTVDIRLRGDVTVNQGSLIIGLDGDDDDTVVKAGSTLYARDNVRVKDSLTGEGALYVEARDGNLRLDEGVTANNVLSLTAGNKIISYGVIKVTGSDLLMQQGLSLDTADYMFANRANTDLTLISDSGSVTSTTGGNAANKWKSIGAHANQNITLARSNGKNEISLGDSGTAGKSLWAENGFIDIDGFNVENSADFADWDLEAGTSLSINVVHKIALGGDVTAHSGSVELTSDSDYWYGDDVIVDGKINAGTTIDIEGEDVLLKDNITAGDDIDIIAHGDFETGSPGASSYTAGGDVTVQGTIITTGGSIYVEAGDNIELQDTAQALENITLVADVGEVGTGNVDAQILNAINGNVEIFSSNDTTNLHDDVTAGSDVTLHNNTIAVDGVLIKAGQDVIVGDGTGDGTTLTGEGALTLEADRDIILGGTVEASVDTAGDLMLWADKDGSGGVDGGDMIAYDNITVHDGSLEIYSSDDTTILSGDWVKASDDVTLHNNTELDGGNQRIEATNGKLTTEGTVHKTSSGNLDMFGGYNVDNWPTASVWAQGDVTVDDGQLTIKGNAAVRLDGSLYSSGDMVLAANQDADLNKGSLVHYGDTIQSLNGDVDMSASGGWINLDGGNATEYVTAGHDILLRDQVWVQYSRKLEAGDDVVLAGGKSISSTNALHGGNLTVVAGDDIILGVSNVDTHETTAHIGTPGNVTTSHNMVLDAGDDIYAHGDLTSNEGSVELYSSDDTTYLGGDVTAFNNVLLNNNTEFTNTDDQYVTAQTGSVTANGYLEKPEDGSLYLLAKTDISLAGHVLVENGGISIIAEEGKIFTPGGDDDTLNVAITGYSNHGEGAGVVLPKDYDQPAPDAAGDYETGLAAIVIMSEETLNLGSGAQLTANGEYDTTGAVDDRPGVDFLNHVEGYKNPGNPIDVAIYVASNAGNVDVGSLVNPIPIGGVMVVDAYDTVTFDGINNKTGVPAYAGGQFVNSLIAGNVGWLEVCSRITATLPNAIIDGTLPYASDPGALYPGTGRYVLRGENPDVGTGAWVLYDSEAAPLADETGEKADRQVLGADGCPALIAAAAEELGIAADELNVFMANSMVASTDIQPCETCARLVDATTILSDEDGSRMAAMMQVFNELAPADAPFTPATAASIATAFEGAAEGSQYASVVEYVDAFVQYVAVLDTEMGSPVGDSLAFVMEKHGAGITANDNTNIAAFVAARLEAGNM